MYIAPFYILCISQSDQAWITQFYLQIHHACLSFVSVHQMAPPLTRKLQQQLQYLRRQMQVVCLQVSIFARHSIRELQTLGFSESDAVQLSWQFINWVMQTQLTLSQLQYLIRLSTNAPGRLPMGGGWLGDQSPTISEMGGCILLTKSGGGWLCNDMHHSLVQHDILSAQKKKQIRCHQRLF